MEQTEQRKNLCALIPLSLHTKVRTEQEKAAMTLNEYIIKVLTEYYKGCERNEEQMNGKTRTLAFQVSEELFQRVKKYLNGHEGLSQKEFVVGLIEKAVSEWEAEQSDGSFWTDDIVSDGE